MIDQLGDMRNRFNTLSQVQPLPRGELESMRSQLQRMSADLAEQARRFPNQQRDEMNIAKSYLNGLMADLDHVLYGKAMPQQNQPGQAPQGRQGRRQQKPALPVPQRVPAPPRTMAYEVIIGPLPNQRFRLTLPPGETIQSLYSAAVQRGQVVDREFQAGALKLNGAPARPELISGQIPPSEANAASQEDMLRLLMLHNCFSLLPDRSPAGGDYTGGGGGHIAGFDVAQMLAAPTAGPGATTRSQRLDQFRDDYLAQQRAGAAVRVAVAPQQAPPSQTGSRRRKGG